MNISSPRIYKKGHHVNTRTTHKHTISSDSDDEVSAALKYPNESESSPTLSHPLTSASLSELDTNMSKKTLKKTYFRYDTEQKEKIVVGFHFLVKEKTRPEPTPERQESINQ